MMYRQARGGLFPENPVPADLPDDIAQAVDDARRGRVQPTTLADLLPVDALTTGEHAYDIWWTQVALTRTWLDGWQSVPAPLRGPTVEVISLLSRHRQHPSLKVSPLGPAGVFTAAAPFDVELTFRIGTNAQVTWLTVAC